ncbi:DNA-binding protein [Aneurinibacillus sp. XH2]|uniref:helix-turn-helix domain-containing protein n=1 Tax=Aneurinibacillus sp. XH2 TaxID=1450761 RepID=UPI00070B7BAC|nr:helix-turn-helix transcriptional regulator [Aneurinibacillus sp. XH2]AMA72739.1 DNA-binding protein [Aneurinibacillus sp. XH2]
MVYQNVKRIREAKGITKTRVASLLNMSLQGYKHIEDGTVRLDVERLRVIAELLSVDIAVFFDEKLTDSVIKEIEKLKSA